LGKITSRNDPRGAVPSRTREKSSALSATDYTDGKLPCGYGAIKVAIGVPEGTRAALFERRGIAASSHADLGRPAALSASVFRHSAWRGQRSEGKKRKDRRAIENV
jgi:hypothetical protein